MFKVSTGYTVAWAGLWLLLRDLNAGEGGSREESTCSDVSSFNNWQTVKRKQYKTIDHT